MIAVLATLRSAPGRRGDLLDALRSDLLPGITEEAGTLTWVLHEDLRDPDLVHVYELYDSKESFVAHVKVVGPRLHALADLMDGVPVLRQAVPVASTGTIDAVPPLG